MMILAHDSERYGYLVMNGSPIPPDVIARRCGSSLEQYETILAELTAAAVPSRTPEGIIYSRRMVKDAKEREQGSMRQQRYRERRNAHVTPLSRQSNAGSSSSFSPSGNPPTPLPNPAETRAAAVRADAARVFGDDDPPLDDLRPLTAAIIRWAGLPGSIRSSWPDEAHAVAEDTIGEAAMIRLFETEAKKPKENRLRFKAIMAKAKTVAGAAGFKAAKAEEAPERSEEYG